MVPHFGIHWRYDSKVHRSVSSSCHLHGDSQVRLGVAVSFDTVAWASAFGACRTGNGPDSQRLPPYQASYSRVVTSAALTFAMRMRRIFGTLFSSLTNVRGDQHV
jgi:hypothetical protein